MAVELLVAIAWPLGVGLVLSFALELLLTPRPQWLWQRPWQTFCVHVALWLLVFAVLLALLQRPWFAMFGVDGFLVLLVLINAAKVKMLREPFVFQDFEYFTDTLKHPRLYLPFLGVAKTLAATLLVVVVLYTGIAVEASLSKTFSFPSLMAGALAIGAIAMALLCIGARGKLMPTFHPAADLRTFGLLSSLWAYGVAEGRPISISWPYKKVAATPTTTRPHLVVVQSESFFDPRSWYGGVQADVFEAFDAVRRDATLCGRLQVPVWGANTVRSEFAFLAGIEQDALGVHRFNPYRKLPKDQPATIASFLKAHGYRTVCIHPYPAAFYRRDTAYPQLGFDEFIDLRHFDGAERVGAYVSDMAVARKVEEVLAATTVPTFVFVITMENHGPLHLEAVLPGDIDRYHWAPPPADCDDLTIYLRHLANASRMAGALRRSLEALPNEAWLGWFGDHVPIMPAVYRHLGEPDGNTDYLLWCNRSHSKRVEQVLSVEAFGVAIVRAMGLVR